MRVRSARWRSRSSRRSRRPRSAAIRRSTARPRPTGCGFTLRAAEVELREEIGHAKYDCAYAPADSGASALGFQVQGNWGYIESNRWPGYFCNPDFTSSGPSWSSEFEDVVFSLDQAASVRYLGGGFPEAVARQMATEILGVIEERGVACAGSDAGAAAAPAAVASPASDSSDGSGSAAGASTPGSDDSSGGAASSGGGESSGGAAGGGTTAGEGDALTTEQSSDEGGPFAGFVLGDGPVDVSAEEAGRRRRGGHRTAWHHRADPDLGTGRRGLHARGRS